MTPNNALERTVNYRGAQLIGEAASWPAAQLNR